MKFWVCLLCLVPLMSVMEGQQNRTMFHLYEVPQTNLLNPAVPMPCGWVIGLPVISSIHYNLGNNFFSLRQVMFDEGDGIYRIDPYGIESDLKRRNFVVNEFHVQLLGLGYKSNEWSFYFSINEKNNFFISVSRDLGLLLLKGNAQFVGSEANVSGTGINFSHYREFALSVSKDLNETEKLGVRAKLLFGKMNAVSKLKGLSLRTEDPTYNLEFNGYAEIKTSAPVYAVFDNNEFVEFRDDNAGVNDLIFNGQNPGVAFDFGYLRDIDEHTVFSGALLDVGFIYWQKYIHNYLGRGTFYYNGILSNSTYDYYWQNFGEAFMADASIANDSEPYVTFLSPKLIGGFHRQFNAFIGASITGDLQLYRTKLISGITVGADLFMKNNIKVISSMSYQYNTINNIGLGIVLGHNPLQFYLISDNINSFIWPFETRSVNLKFGINIIPGCKINKSGKRQSDTKIKNLDGVCGWIKEGGRRKRY
ncbi:MAG: hypothetical protein JW717_08915 [Marinilabiliaceae bacterium]|nr:hypothetical protein [Marinilabiliaceae bacterium]